MAEHEYKPNEKKEYPQLLHAPDAWLNDTMLDAEDVWWDG
jgi:hypothetical protein